MNKNTSTHLALVSLLPGIMLISGLCPAAHAKVGSAIIKGNVLQWGQYRNIKGVIAVAESNAPAAPSAQSVPERIGDLPVAGASCVLYCCQRPESRFFTPDGGKILDAQREQLRRDMTALNTLDMLPIIVVFDPASDCRLESKQAYTTAALTLVNELKQDFWFVLCITDRCGDPAWSQPGVAMDPGMVREIAGAVQNDNRDVILAAGSPDPRTNDALTADRSSIRILIARVDALGRMADRAEKMPAIEVLDAAAIKPGPLKTAVRDVFEKPSWGFAVDFTSTVQNRGQAVTAFLNNLGRLVDEYQKTSTPSVPPTPGDTASLKPGEAQEGFISLFNGKDLSGWVILDTPGNFVVKDGVIRLEKETGGWLRSWNAYTDYVFRGEYKIIKDGNSGFYMRSPLVGRQSRIGFEFQIRGQTADAPVGIDSTGSIYDAKAPDGNFMKPDDWNEVEITCIGTEIKIVWNGKLAHHFRYEDVEFLKPRATRGYIGLQDHHDFVEFRNLRIKPLK